MPPELLSYRPLVERYLKKISSSLAVFAYTNIFVWQDFFKFECVEIDDHLCVFASDDVGTFLYLPPLAKNVSPKVIGDCFARMKKANKGRGVTRIENVMEEQLKSYPLEEYQIHKKGYDYLYYRQDLVDFKGDAFKTKRNAVNHFVKHHECKYLPFAELMAVECMDLYNRWAKEKSVGVQDEMHLAMIEDNRLVHRRIFKNFRELGLVGRVIKVGDKIVAYTFGYFLNKETFCDLLEIADPQYKGAATYIFWLLCNDQVLKDMKFINVMDDMVPESVNRTKMSFRPAVMLPSYTVSPKLS